MRLFQDVTGTLPARLPGQPVALVTDAANPLRAGPELVPAQLSSVSVEQSGGTTATWNPATRVMQNATGSAAAYPRFRFPLSGLTEGHSYFVELRLAGDTAAVTRVRLASVGEQADLRRAADAPVFSGIARAGAGFVQIMCTAAGGPFSVTLESLSVREVTGFMARQETAAARPLLGRHPRGGRRNLLTATGEFSAAAWKPARTGSGEPPLILSAVTGPLPDSRGAALRFRPGTGGAPGHSQLRQTVPLPPEAGGSDQPVSLRLALRAHRPADIGQRLHLRGEGLSGSPETSLPLEEGWQWLTLSGTATSGTTEVSLLLEARVSSGAPEVEIACPQLEIAATPGPYQTVSTPLDVTQNGVPEVWFLSCEGERGLTALLPAGSFETGWVTGTGESGFTLLESDGTTPTSLLQAGTTADLALRAGSFSPEERAMLQGFWREAYGP